MHKSTALKHHTGISFFGFVFFPASLLLYLPPPLCSHMRLMWRDSNILQKSLAFRWLRGSLISRSLTFSYSFFNNLPLLSSLFDSLLLCILTTWPSRSFDLWPRSRRSRPPCQMMLLEKLTEVHRASLAKQELLVWRRNSWTTTTKCHWKAATALKASVPSKH